MNVHSLNIGRPQIVIYNGRQYSTSINRKPVEGPVELTPTGFVGDRISEAGPHGGEEMAACCYPREHYDEWRRRLGRELVIPSFGENLTTDGLVETQVCVGDEYEIGGATVQVSQPRMPCWKLANKLETKQAVEWIHASGHCGYYLRVLRPGRVATCDAIRLVRRGCAEFTIDRLMRLKLEKRPDETVARRLAELPELSASWRQHFAERARCGSRVSG